MFSSHDDFSLNTMLVVLEKVQVSKGGGRAISHRRGVEVGEIEFKGPFLSEGEGVTYCVEEICFL